MIFIFDLDHTVIDSSHRQLTDANGSLDLAHWREHCTAEMIARDSLLPLADVMRRYFNEGHTIVVCTARICTQPDFDFMREHNLKFHHFLSRYEGDMRPDAEYKSAKLEEWAIRTGQDDDWRKDAVMFDDNTSVIRRMMRERLMCFDAIKYNERLAA